MIDLKKEIYLAGGCFWGCQKFFELLEGIIEVKVGYANGNIENPTYEQVCTGITGFAEAMQVIYDSSKVDLNHILEQYYFIIDPTTLNRQGPDKGTQYRTGIYYTSEEDKTIIDLSLNKLQKKYANPIVVENLPLKNFYEAEEYHQNYLDKNPNGYCHIGQDKFNYAKNVKI